MALKYRFNPKTKHNPNYDIVQCHINHDCFITYIHGSNLMEYYAGKNYNVTSQKRSFSKVYTFNEMPGKYVKYYELAKKAYFDHFIGKNEYITKVI